MLTIFSAIIGFIGGLAPEVMKFFKDKADKRHELDLMDKQIEAQKQTAAMHLEEVGLYADVADSVAVYKSAETKITGYKWLDGLIESYNSGVRPTITYGVLVLYLTDKFGVTTNKYTEFDESVLMLVLGYWFGQRAAKFAFGRK
jgi:hypothetical protein